MPKVYIVILNYKRWQDVQDCLLSVFKSNYKRFTIIVIDNDSQNNSLQIIMKWLDDLSSVKKEEKEVYSYKYCYEKGIGVETDFDTFPLYFVQNNSNKGFAAGNNIVIQALLKYEAHLWLLNPDIIVKENTLHELIAFAAKCPSKSIIGNTVKSYSNKETVLLLGGARINYNSATISLIKNENKIDKVDFIYGGSLFTHTSHFREIGLLPEEYFLFWEEADWCYQARSKGYKMLFCNSAICYDKGSTTIGKGFLANYYYTLNGFRFLSKYKRDKIAMAMVFGILRGGWRIISGKWARALGVFKGMIDFLERKNVNK